MRFNSPKLFILMEKYYKLIIKHNASIYYLLKLFKETFFFQKDQKFRFNNYLKICQNEFTYYLNFGRSKKLKKE